MTLNRIFRIFKDTLLSPRSSLSLSLSLYLSLESPSSMSLWPLLYNNVFHTTPCLLSLSLSLSLKSSFAFPEQNPLTLMAEFFFQIEQL